MTASHNPAELDDQLCVAMALDAAYLPWAATVIRSCCLTNPGVPISFEVIHDGSISGGDRERLACVADGSAIGVRFHGVEPSMLVDMPTTAAFGTIVWLRFYLPELLSSTQKVLYLDADTLVLSSLTDLWNAPMAGMPLAAVANVVEPAARDHVRELGVEYPGGFFNSGVLLLDLAAMRRDGATEKLLRFARDHRTRLLWPDQDALNVVFARRWAPLHPRWNAQNSLWTWRPWAVEVFGKDLVLQATETPAIRHFEGPSLSKPWHYLCPHPMRDEYRAILATTPWANVPLDDRTVATRAIGTMPSALQLRVYKYLLAVRERTKRISFTGWQRLASR